MNRWRSAAMALTAAVGVWGCGSGTSIPQPQKVEQALTLSNFSDCNELQKYIQDTAVLDMRSQLEASKQGYGGWPWMYPMMDAAGATANKSAGPTAYTTTNVQVAGVDEADFVKNDGTRIFVLSGDKLYASSSWPAAQTQLQSKTQIEGWPREMFLDESNHLVVFSTLWTSLPFDNRGASSMYPCLVDGWYCGYYWANTTKVTVFDVTNIASPKVIQQTYLPGYYDDSRRIGESVRIVLGDDFQWPTGVEWWPQLPSNYYNGAPNPVVLAAAYDALMAKNEQIIRATPLSSWLPPAKRLLQNGTSIDVPYACSDFSRSNAPTKLGMVTVATLNLTDPNAPITQNTIVAQVGQVYASTSSLYVATEHWWWWYQPGEVDYTYLYKFDLSQPDRAVFQAAGGVPGHIINQFSMDELNGNFRVATNIGTRVPDPDPKVWWGDMQYTNKVFVLGQSGKQLSVIGETPEITPGEQLLGSRFIGNQGFIVTGKQLDPLTTLDLSNPAAPKIVGQLPIPGMSSYLQGLDATHVIAVGENVTQSPPYGEQLSVQLQIFDVSDLANPKSVSVQEVGSGWAWSEAQWDHKAFNYFPQEGLLAIPFYDWWPCSWTGSTCDWWTNFESDLRVFKVDPHNGFVPQGALSMKDVYETFANNSWDYYWAPMVRRSIMATDSAGNVFVYAISDAGIRVAQLGTLATPLVTDTFDITQP